MHANKITRILLGFTQIPPLVIVVLLLAAPAAFAGDYIIIANKENSIQTLTLLDAKRIFLGKKNSWEDGSKIEMIINHNAQILEPFIRDVVNKSHSQFTIYWKKKLFSGRGTLPKSFKNDQEVIDFITEHKNAIGFIAASSANDTIKQVKIQ